MLYGPFTQRPELVEMGDGAGFTEPEFTSCL